MLLKFTVSQKVIDTARSDLQRAHTSIGCPVKKSVERLVGQENVRVGMNEIQFRVSHKNGFQFWKKYPLSGTAEQVIRHYDTTKTEDYAGVMFPFSVMIEVDHDVVELIISNLIMEQNELETWAPRQIKSCSSYFTAGYSFAHSGPSSDLNEEFQATASLEPVDN